MSLNTGFFAPYSHRRKQPTTNYLLPLSNQHPLLPKSSRPPTESRSVVESFLPSIPTSDGRSDAHRPYRRNDFANNHLFLAKQKLAGIFLDQPIMSTQSRNDLFHLFDSVEVKQKYRRAKQHKRQESHTNWKSISTPDSHAHLSIVNLVMKPSISSPKNYNSSTPIAHDRTQLNYFYTKPSWSSMDWINPAIPQQVQSTSNLRIENKPESIYYN